MSQTDEQAKLWNGAAGCGWVDAQALLDQMFLPLQDRLTEFVLAEPTQHVLDVGCGTGGTTVAIAKAVGANSRCVGVDISEPMIAAARARAEREGASATFVVDNAQSHDFAAAGFDAIISRFGVMFFDDSVHAFTNLHRASRQGARLGMIVWRSAADNPFMTVAEKAAAPLLPNIPTREPNAPGQFAFADKGRVERMLADSGWSEIDIQPLDVTCSFPSTELEMYFTRLGLLSRVIDQADQALRQQVVKTVRTAFEPFVHGLEVSFVAACWWVTARH